MLTRRRLLAASMLAFATTACAAAAWIVIDTIAATLRARSAVPWFDEWDEVRLLKAWSDGSLSILGWLFTQHNEHRILFPRLVFLVDDFVFRGQGRLTLAALLTVQAAEAFMLVRLLGRCRPRSPAHWLIGSSVVALMFSLRQAENFASGFQLQFFGVFAAATASFVFLSDGVERQRRGSPWVATFAASLGMAGVATFTMANGIAAAALLPILLVIGRLPAPAVLGSAVWALTLGTAYFWGGTLEHQDHLFDPIARPDLLLTYVSTYLGNVLQFDQIASAPTIGLVGLVVFAAASMRILLRPARADSLFTFGIMAFVILSAAITATGRMAYGDVQAMSGRYVTGASTFWAAALVHWWVELPSRSPPFPRRVAIVLSCVVLLVGLCRGQKAGRHWLRAQDYAQSDAGDLLLVGFADPAVLRRIASDPDEARRLAPVLRRAGISIFGSADAGILGLHLSRLGELAGVAECEGRMSAAFEDPSLGAFGVRVAGTAWSANDGEVLRVVITDGRDVAVGLGAGGGEGDGRAWRGYAVSSVAASLTAYAILADRSLCRLGSMTVTAPVHTGDASR